MQRTCKVVLFGSAGVGKSALLNRLLGEEYTDTYQATIGADYKTMKVPDHNLTLQYWDMGNPSQVKAKVVSKCIKDAHLMFLIFNTHDRSSYEALQGFNQSNDHLNFLTNNTSNGHIQYILIGTHYNEESESDVVTVSEASAFAKRNLATIYIPISSKTGEGVDNLLAQIIQSTIPNTTVLPDIPESDPISKIEAALKDPLTTDEAFVELIEKTVTPAFNDDSRVTELIRFGTSPQKIAPNHSRTPDSSNSPQTRKPGLFPEIGSDRSNEDTSSQATEDDAQSENSIEQDPQRLTYPQIDLLNNLALVQTDINQKTALKNIIRCLEDGLKSNNQAASKRHFERNHYFLKKQLDVLQESSLSLFNSALNVVLATLVYCSVIGIAGFYLSGKLDKPNPFLFFAFGEKQQAQWAIQQSLENTLQRSVL